MSSRPERFSPNPFFEGVPIGGPSCQTLAVRFWPISVTTASLITMDRCRLLNRLVCAVGQSLTCVGQLWTSHWSICFQSQHKSEFQSG